MRTTIVSLLLVLFLGTTPHARADIESYWAAKAGPLFFLGDTDDLDTGLNLSFAYGVQLVKILGIELESGYLWGEDTSGVDEELQGIPIMANAKLSLPILFLNVSGGAGVGGIYLDHEVGSVDEEDFVFGGNLFLGASFAAIGLFASSLTRNQIIAFIIGMALCFGLTLIDKMLILFPRTFLGILGYLGADFHFQNISKGIIDSRDFLYFLSIVFVGLYSTHLVMEEKN